MEDKHIKAGTVGGVTLLTVGGIQHQLNTGNAIELNRKLNDALKEQNALIIEKLDELSDVAEHWKRNRSNGRTPAAIRSALVMLIDEIQLASRQ